MASRSIGVLTLDLVAKVGGFTSGMNQAERSANKSLTAIEKRAYDFGRTIGGTFRSLATLGAGALGIGGIAETIQGFLGALNNLDRLDELAAKTGISTEELSKLGYAAKLTGTDLEDLNSSLDKLAKNAVKALDPTSKQAEIFKALGVEVTDAQGNLKSTDDLLKDVSDGFKALNDETLEAAAAQELFGKSGAGLLEFLNLGSQGLAEMGQKATDLGAVFDEETTKAAAELKDEFDNLKTVVSALMVDVLRPLLPLLKDTAVELQNVAKESAGAGGSAQTAGEDIAELLTSIKSLGTGATTALEGMREVLNGLQDQAVGYTNLVLGRAQALEQIRRSGDRIAGAFDDKSPKAAVGFPSYLGSDFLEPRSFSATEAPFSVIPKSAIVDAKALADAISGVTTETKKTTKATKELTEAEKAWQDIMEVNEIIDEESRKTQEQLRRDRQDRADDFARLIDDIQTQNDLLGQTEEQQDLINTARQYGIDLASEEGRVLTESLAAYHENRKAIEDQVAAMDSLRNSFTDFLTDVKEGKSVWDSLKSAVDSFADTLFQLAASNIAEQIFGQSGTTGGGASGDFFSAILSSFFGGGRAKGGPVMPNTLYEVNERGPELLTVGNRDYLMMGGQHGMVTANGGGGGVSMVNNFNYAAPYDARTEEQKNARLGYETRLAVRRSGGR